MFFVYLYICTHVYPYIHVYMYIYMCNFLVYARICLWVCDECIYVFAFYCEYVSLYIYLLFKTVDDMYTCIYVHIDVC